MPKKASQKTSNAAMADVASPGKSLPNTGNRPIIVTRKPLVQDPMVVKDQQAGSDDNTEKPIPGPPEIDASAKKLSSRKSKGVKIAPIDEEADTSLPASGAVITPNLQPAPEKSSAIAKAEAAVEEATKETASSDATTEPPATDESSVPEEAANTDKTDKSDETSKAETDSAQKSDGDSGDVGLVDELAKQAASKKQQQEEDKIASAQREKLEELIAAKTYNVPTSQVTKRRLKYGLLTVVALLIMVAVAVGLALDAGVIDIGVSPLTYIIAD